LAKGFLVAVDVAVSSGVAEGTGVGDVLVGLGVFV
jgi:hypothetical protein